LAGAVAKLAYERGEPDRPGNTASPVRTSLQAIEHRERGGRERHDVLFGALHPLGRERLLISTES
jgi:hypothetical protein